MNTLEQLIDAAIAKALEIRTVTREDGSTFQACWKRGSADNGVVQAYVVPVTARTMPKREHFRATFYLMQNGQWKRTNRAAAEAALKG